MVSDNGSKIKFPLSKCIHELFEVQVEKTPHNCAFIFENQTVSYLELNQQANQLAHCLVSRGLRPGNLIALLVDRSIDMFVGLMGILKSGCAYVPIDPKLPEERIHYMLNDSQIEVVVSQFQLRKKLEKFSHYILYLDTDSDSTGGSEIIASRSKENVVIPSNSSKNLAYAIYTSGSTGRPKGVMIEHRSVVNLLYSMHEKLDFSSKDCILALTTISFDMAVPELYLPFVFGAKSILLRNASNPQIIEEALSRHPVTILQATPSTLRMLLNNNWQGKNDLTIYCGGEALPAEISNHLYDKVKKFWNLYGPTEATVWSTYCEINSKWTSNNFNASIGLPINNTNIYLMTPDEQSAPKGSVGELCISGEGLARGYLNKLELSSNKFIPNPFNNDPNDRLYKTGDLARYLEDDRLEFIGRIDDQVKINGFRIELSEIEHQLNCHKLVQNSVVLAQHIGESNKRLIGYICPKPSYLDHIAYRDVQDKITEWGKIWDEQYADTSKYHYEKDKNYIGWKSSYDNKPIPLDQMNELVKGTINQIKTLKPRNLLEVGCGTGLLLFRYAPWCDSVHALEISKESLTDLQKEIENRKWSHIKLIYGDALYVRKLKNKTFDTVVINSVIQYFPSCNYLEEVILNLLPLVEENGHIFIGDVRNLDLLTAQTASIEKAHLIKQTRVEVFSKRVQRRISNEKELLISPSYFINLKKRLNSIDRVDIRIKHGLNDNEVLRYRYDVILYKRKSKKINQKPLSWIDFESMKQIKKLIKNGQEMFGISGLNNSRIKDDIRLANEIRYWKSNKLIYPQKKSGELSASAISHQKKLNSTLSFAEKEGYCYALTWSQKQLDLVDIIFSRTRLPEIQSRDYYTQTYLSNYPQLSENCSQLTKQLKTHLEHYLPQYMIPHFFIVLERLPLTYNGKIDKRALPTIDETDLIRKIYVAPTNTIETKLCKLWQELLKLNQVGIHDNFFYLGGHSLLAIQMVTRLQQIIGYPLTLKQLYLLPTISQLSKHFLESKHTDYSSQAVQLPILMQDESARYKPFPLTDVQQAFLLENSSTHSYSEYDIPYLNIKRLSAAWNTLVKRHDMLRAVFNISEMTQRILIDAPDYDITYLDLYSESEINREGKLLKIREEMLNHVFSPDQWPSFEIRITRLDKNEYRLHYSKDALTSDVVSERMLFRELFFLYWNRKSSLPVINISFRDYMITQKSLKRSNLYQNSRNYWLKRLTNFPLAPTLPLLKNSEPLNQSSFNEYQFVLDSKKWNKLQMLSKSINVTPAVFILNLFSLVLSHWSEQSRFSLILTLNNRLPFHEDVKFLVGNFISVILLEFNINLTDSIENNARLTQEQLWSDLEYRHFSGIKMLKSIKNRLNSSHDASIPFVFTSTIGDEEIEIQSKSDNNFQNQMKPNLFISNQVYQMWLGCVMSETQNGGISVTWTAKEGLFQEGLIDTMFESFCDLLKNISDKKHQPFIVSKNN